MKRYIVAATLTAVFLSALSARTAAPQTPYPGQMTEARVWVQNRGASEAVSVDLRSVSLDRPLRVHLTNGETGEGEPLSIRLTQQGWQYDTFTLRGGAAGLAELNARGGGGWEVAGIVAAGGGDREPVLLLKRPR